VQGNSSEKGKVMDKITRIGVDLAKNVIQLHGVDSIERVVVRKAISRQKFLEWFANLEPCLVAMEACSAAHYWARKLRALGLFLPQGIDAFRAHFAEALEDGATELNGVARTALARGWEHLQVLDQQITWCDAQVAMHAKHDSNAQRVMAVIGIGPLTAPGDPAVPGRTHLAQVVVAQVERTLHAMGCLRENTQVIPVTAASDCP
jgi:transposase